VILFGPRANQVAAHERPPLAVGSPPSAPLQLIPIDSDQNWGAATTQLVHALWDQHALVILALDRDAAHLSEQFALKAFVPVLALSDDKSLTSTNVPWIFRLPSATDPASALRIVQAAEARSGANSQRLRDQFASGASLSGFAFQPTGEPKLQ
jgi:hypothetical protein